MRLAIVHDRLTQLGGAERVVQAMQRIWPASDLYTSVYNPALAEEHGFENVRGTYLQRLPHSSSMGRVSLPLHPHAFGRLRLDGYDAVISSSAFFAKCVRPPREIPHLCYCYTPARFLWDFRDTHLRERSRWPARAAAQVLTPMLRRADRRGVEGVDQFVAISRFIESSIERNYGRSSIVIPPPVDVDRFTPAPRRGDYLLALARLDPYKRIDAAIEASARVGIPLKVIGEGVDAARLRSRGSHVELLGWVDESTKSALLSGALALLAPQVEDFGIAMVESLAAGTPVIAPARGGALEIVTDGETGVLYDPDDPDGLTRAIERRTTLHFSPADLHAASLRYSEEAFASAMRATVESLVPRP